MRWWRFSVMVVAATVSLSACSPNPPNAANPAANATTSVAQTTTPSETVSPPASTAPASTPPAATTSAPATPEKPVTPPPSAVSSPPVAPATSPVATVPSGASGVYTTAEVHAWVKDPASAPGKLVFLTFDDGPNNVITPKVLDVLKAAQVHATFFIVGNEVPGAPEMLKREVAEGHRIALHSLTHDYKKLYPGRSANAARVALEFDKTMAAVRNVLGADFTTTAWRYPGGHMSWKNMAASDAELAARGATWLDWNAMTGDAEPKKRRPTTEAAMVAMATQPIAAGEPVVVMLAHDSRGKDLTVASLSKIIDAYKAAGYGFGTLS